MISSKPGYYKLAKHLFNCKNKSLIIKNSLLTDFLMKDICPHLKKQTKFAPASDFSVIFML